MALETRKQIFLSVFVLASLMQSMYQWHFAGVLLPAIEQTYQLSSSLATLSICSAELGKLVASLTIIYFGSKSRLCSRTKLLLGSLVLAALSAFLVTSPHFLLDQRLELKIQTSGNSDLLLQDEAVSSLLSGVENQTTTTTTAAATSIATSRTVELCQLRTNNQTNFPEPNNRTTPEEHSKNYIPTIISKRQLASAVVIICTCLLAVGFSTGTTHLLGGFVIDDLAGKQAIGSVYSNLARAASLLGPVLGSCLAAVCLRLDSRQLTWQPFAAVSTDTGAWWLGFLLIGGFHLLLVLPLCYFGSLNSGKTCDEIEPMHEYEVEPGFSGYSGARRNLQALSLEDQLARETYKAAEDHDIGCSRDLPPYMLTMDPNTLIDHIGASGRQMVGRQSYSQELDLELDLDLGSTSGGQLTSGELIYSSRERLQTGAASSSQNWFTYNFGRNLIFSQLGGNAASGLMASMASKPQQQQQQQQQQQPQHQQVDSQEQQSTSSSYNTTSAGGEQRYARDSYVTMRGDSGERAQNALASSDAFAGLDSASISLRSIASTSTSIVEAPPPPSSSGDNDDFDERLSNLTDLQEANPTRTLLRLAANPMLVLRLIADGFRHAASFGVFLFMPKYLIEQFQVSQAQAVASSGLAGLLCAALGSLGSGSLARLFDMNAKLVSRWLAASSLASAMLLLLMMQLACPQSQLQVTASCSSMCQCSSNMLEPVCVGGSKSFASACIAGCPIASQQHTGSGLNHYRDCTCHLTELIKSTGKQQEQQQQQQGASSTSSGDLLETRPVLPVNATTDNEQLETLAGKCELVHCDGQFWWYLAALAMFAAVQSSGELGALMLNLRCVSERDRNTTLAVGSLNGSLFSFASAIMYSFAVDSACLSWTWLKDSCSTTDDSGTRCGACQVYDNDKLRVHLHLVGAASLLLAWLADLWVARRASELDFCFDRPVTAKPTTLATTTTATTTMAAATMDHQSAKSASNYSHKIVDAKTTTIGQSRSSSQNI